MTEMEIKHYFGVQTSADGKSNNGDGFIRECFKVQRLPHGNHANQSNLYNCIFLDYTDDFSCFNKEKLILILYKV